MALLEEELTTLYQREEHVKNLQEEISALEEVRLVVLLVLYDGRYLKIFYVRTFIYFTIRIS